ncbi:MAG: hypothetical protein Phyf2KO_05440 [Phycisphaerales bacterium]
MIEDDSCCFGTSAVAFGDFVIWSGCAARLRVVDVSDCDESCPVDTNDDGQVTGADFTTRINAFNNDLPECDQNGDESCTPADFAAWIENFNAGCD